MNLSDLVLETFLDNEVKRICAECLDPQASHEYQLEGAGRCLVEDCDCLVYIPRKKPMTDDEFTAALAQISALADAVLAHPRLAERMSADIAAVADMMDDLKVADE